MPRSPMINTSMTALLTQLNLGAIMQVYPRSLLEAVLDDTGTNSLRRRLNPAYVIMYLVIMLAFYARLSVRENLRLILDQLREVFGAAVVIAVGSAITKARQRLASQPFQELFRRVVRPVGEPGLPGCFWRGWRLVSVDGSVVDVQSTPENIARFGLHRNQHGTVGRPAIKFTALMESGTHVIFGVCSGGVHEDERVLFDRMPVQLEPDMLLLSDRNFFDYERWRRCSQQCGLLWRVKKSLRLKVVRELADGSYLSVVRPSEKLVGQGRCRRGEEQVVRVIEYQLQLADGSPGEVVRLLANLLDPAAAPAAELAALYPERYDQEGGFDEIKTHLLDGGRVLRGQLPDLVEQELYGFLLAHFVVRKVMAEAAREAAIDPGTLSYVHAVRVIKRRLKKAFPPSEA